MTSAPQVVLTAHLFSELDAALVQVLKDLTPDEWRAPTVVPKWNVHQVAAHLLDTALRRLSMCRDGWSVPGPPIQSEHDLVTHVNHLNAVGVEVFGRVSPQQLIALTEITVGQLSAHFASLDPMAVAPWPVSWAGESASLNWFDTARELTERWHHQQQILLATNRPGIMTPRLYGPVLDTFMRVLPRVYRAVAAPAGTACDVIVSGECGGRWRVARHSEGWQLVSPGETPAVSTTSIPEDLAWRIFTKSASPAEVRRRVSIIGNADLGALVLRAVAIVG